MANEREIIAELLLDTKKFDQSAKDSVGSLNPIKDALGKIAVAVVAAFSVKKVVDFTVSVTKLSSEFERLQYAAQAVGELHGIASEQTDKLTQSLIDNGIQTDVANRSFIQFAQNGLDQNLLPALARGAQDLAVFADSGETSSDVLDRLSYGILTLNSLMLRRAGVAVDVNQAEADFAKNLGISADALTIQQKRQAVTLKVLEQLKNVQGLYTISQKTAAGQLSSNVRILNEFKAAIGANFQNAFLTLIKGFNDFVKVLTVAIKEGGKLHSLFVGLGTVASFLANVIVGLFQAIAGLFGVELSNAIDTASGELDANASSADAAAASQDNLANSTEKAGKAAKGALASFDELNVLQQDTGGAGAGATTPEDAGFPLTQAADFSGILDEINAKQKEWQDRVDSFGAKLAEFFKPLVDAYNEHLAPVLAELGGKIWDGLRWIWENLLKPLANWIVSEFGPVFLEFVGTVLETWNLTWEAMQPILQDLWDNVLQPLFAWLGGFAIKVFGWLIEKISELNTWIKNNEEAWGTIATVFLVVVGIIAGVLAGGLALIIGLIGGVIYVLANAGKAWKIFQDLVWLGTQIIGNAFRIVGETIESVFLSAFTAVKNFVKGIINGIIGFINGMISRITTGINSVIFAANVAGSILPGFNPVGYVSAPYIPYLAKGAVIPPNASFLAVMGDQTSGKNIEAPEALLRQIVREELANQNINVTMTVDGDSAGKALVNLLHPKLQAETRRIGPNLAKGTA